VSEILPLYSLFSISEQPSGLHCSGEGGREKGRRREEGGILEKIWEYMRTEDLDSRNNKRRYDGNSRPRWAVSIQ